MTGKTHDVILAAKQQRGLRVGCLCVTFFITLLTCADLPAQQSAGNEADNPAAADDTSKQVDESEENYRARMELRDQRYREQPRADMIYSSQAGKEKIDQLPQASRTHIRNQLRDMIIASRQWRPGEDISDYPYEPSAAAQTDAQLRNREREAWAEQLEKYQQREAAAYAGAEGGENARADGQEAGSGHEGAGKKGDQGGTEANVAPASQNQSGAARSPESYQEPERAVDTISTAGVSENALSFLQGKGGQTGAAQEPDEKAQTGEQSAAAGETGGQADENSVAASASRVAQALPGSLTVDELALLQGMNPAPGAAHDEPSATQSIPPSVSSAVGPVPSGMRSDELSAPQSDAGTPAGTLIIDDLKKLDGVAPSVTELVTSRPTADEPVSPDAANPAEPGTLDIAELKRLQGD